MASKDWSPLSGKLSIILSMLLLALFGQCLSANPLFNSSNFPCQVTTGIPLENMASALTATTSSSAPSAFIPFGSGFTFWYAGVSYTGASMSPDGWIKLGSTGTAQTSANFNNTTNYPILAPYWTNLSPVQPLKYLMTGTAPFRKFVISWWSDGTYLSSASFQIWLHETTNRIDFVYGNVFQNAGQYSIGAGAVISNQATYVNIATSSNPASSIVFYNNIYNQNTIAIPSGTMYSFVPANGNVNATPDPVWTSVSAGCLGFAWSDSSANEAYWALLRSTDNINFTVLDNVPSTTTGAIGTVYQFTDTNLTPQTHYYYQIKTFSFCSSFSHTVYFDTVTPPPSLAGTFQIPGDFSSITEAFEGIKCMRMAGPVILELQSNYSDSMEIFPLKVNEYLHISEINTLAIRPAANATNIKISDSAATVLFDVVNAKGLIIDGSPGGNGYSTELTLQNFSTLGTLVRFQNESGNHKFSNLNLLSSCASSTNGSVFIGGTNGLHGNDSIEFRNCYFSNTPTGVPANLIYSSGTVGKENNYIIIDSCVFENYGCPSLNTNSAAINVLFGNDEWEITHCSFFCSTPTVSQGTLFSVRLLDGSAMRWVINNNFFGGTAPGASGGKTYISSRNGSALYVRGSRNGICDIQGNVFRNLDYNLTPVTTPILYFIQIDSANANIGTVDENIFGRMDSTDNIILHSNTYLDFTGIKVSNSRTCQIYNNQFGGITAIGNGSLGLNLISTGGDSAFVFNNQIGSPSVQNSIQSYCQEYICGITTGHAGYLEVQYNSICNFSKYNTLQAQFEHLIGIRQNSVITSNSVTCKFKNNSIWGFRSYTHNCPMSGIYIENPSYRLYVENNEIYSLISTGGDMHALNGIYYYGNLNYSGTNRTVINSNNIHHIYSESSSGGQVRGIYVSSGAGKCSTVNNMISLGIKIDGTPASACHTIRGISGGGPAFNAFFNSIYIGGIDSLFASLSIGISATNPSGVDSIFNNIVFIDRMTGNTGGTAHLGVLMSSQMIANYNLYYITDPTLYFSDDGTGFPSFTAWQNAGHDQNGIYGLPGYINPFGDTLSVDLHLTGLSPAEGAGMNISWITTDFDNQQRSLFSPTDIGADAGNFIFTGMGTTFDNEASLLKVKPQPSNNSVTISGFDQTATNNVTILDYTGRIVKYTSISPSDSSSETILDISDLPAGTYLITITNDNYWGYTTLIKM